MDSDRLNRWLTLGANLGVLAGIVLILIELDQNAELMRSQIIQSRAETAQEAWRLVATSDHLAGIRAKRVQIGNDQEWVNSLNPEEFVRWQAWIFAMMHNVRGQLYQLDQGFLDRTFWDTTTRIEIVQILRDYPFFKQRCGRMAPELRAALNEVARQEGLPLIPELDENC